MKSTITRSGHITTAQTYCFPSVIPHLKKKLLFVTFCYLIFHFLYHPVAQATVIDLIDYGITIDDTTAFPTMGDALPGVVDISGFDENTGLGTIRVEISGEGDHFVGGFFDHEIDETINTFFNESGRAVGAPEFGQSWEIDEPGFFNGDIFSNFEGSNLSNGSLLDESIGSSPFGNTVFPDDVSMAMGWEFALANGEIATIDFILGLVLPSGFYLAHDDLDSDTTIYFSSILSTQDSSQPNPVPEPSTILLVGIGLMGILFRQGSFRIKPAANK